MTNREVPVPPSSFRADEAPSLVDAVVVGSGPNGLVAANFLADAGWDVVVLEAADEPGGAVRTSEVTAPGFANDLFSSFYPLAAASPVIRGLDLEQHGLRWVHAPDVLANPVPDGPTMVLSLDLGRTAATLDAFAPGDGDAWRQLYSRWTEISEPAVAALLTPFPPVAAAARLGRRVGPSGLLDLGRLAVAPVRRLAEETFAGAGGGLLLAGNALHADFVPESAAGGLFGWFLASLGQQFGFPVPQGGAGRLPAAMVARLRRRGGRVVTACRVSSVVVEGGRAVGVVTADGNQIRARRAVLADVGAPQLYLELLDRSVVPARTLDDLRRFQYDAGTVKVDWALRAPIPWSDPVIGRAGTVHLADSMDHLSRYGYELATGQIPSEPFLLVGQMTTTDPTRSPAGTEVAWAYTHVPGQPRGDAGGEGIDGRWDQRSTDRFVDRMEGRIERLAPGFRSRILARHVLTPPRMEAINPNLVHGAINGGTAQIHQQVVFRPTVGRGRAETPVAGLFLASASAHPGGGVHGAPGSNAARAALWADRRRRLLAAVPWAVRPRR
ncbi:MAG TPA: NAD(P)/FAD-dependent oxidoreductase [Acidimicrobiales bacterium]